MFEHYATEALRLANAVTGARIVDVACGPGTLALLAAQRGHLVDALDFSPAMIERFLQAAPRPVATASGIMVARVLDFALTSQPYPSQKPHWTHGERPR